MYGLHRPTPRIAPAIGHGIGTNQRLGAHPERDHFSGYGPGASGDFNGRTIQKLTQNPALDVSTLPEHIVILTDHGLVWGPYPQNDSPFDLAGRALAPDVENISSLVPK